MIEATLRISQRYSLPPQLASLLHVLIVEDCLTPTLAAQKGLDVPTRQAIRRLRHYMPTLVIENQSRIGYWLSDAQRVGLAVEVGIELPSSTLARMTRERRIAEGVVEYLERSRGTEHISGRADDRGPEIQFSSVQCSSGETA